MNIEKRDTVARVGLLEATSICINENATFINNYVGPYIF